MRVCRRRPSHVREGLEEQRQKKKEGQGDKKSWLPKDKCVSASNSQNSGTAAVG